MLIAAHIVPQFTPFIASSTFSLFIHAGKGVQGTGSLSNAATSAFGRPCDAPAKG